ncbi:MAG: penicillin-binding protein 2 [Alphaproteobacteria bacterium]|nr:penicillin-binding protein 2 [Alphaproteobacteria bacterium]
MFEVGRDIFKHGFTGIGGNVAGHKRLRFIYGLFLIAFIVFAGRTFQLATRGSNRVRQGVGNADWIVKRADIIDRNGDILAKNLMSCDIWLTPKQVKIKKRENVAEFIHELFPHEYSVQNIINMLNASKRVRIKKMADENTCRKALKKRFDGFEVVPEQRRIYPKHRLFSHIVGFVGRSNKDDVLKGRAGVEKEFEDYLTNNTEPLQLSLDSRIQSVFYEQLIKAISLYQAKGAMGMLMNSRTGEMIAMVSLPDFDPENLSHVLMFPPLEGVYEFGSVFKVFNTAMAIEQGITKEYPVTRPYPIKDKFGRVVYNIKDVRTFKPPRPYLGVDEIMLHSCNVGSAQIALDFPYGVQQEFMHRIHMDEPLQLDFGRAAKTLMPRKWGPTERATVSIGHGISVTPMHVMLGINSMTNGGIYIYPTILKKEIGPMMGERVLDSEISERLRGIMYRIAEETTGRNARVPGIKIGGKTGTAEKHVNGKIETSKNMTTFVGVFPIDAPQYIIMVTIDEPQRTEASSMQRTAAWNAVPTAGKILNAILPLLFE